MSTLLTTQALLLAELSDNDDERLPKRLRTENRGKNNKIEAIEESLIMMVPLATSTETIWVLVLILFLVLSLLPNSGSLGLNFVG
jgi:hypothetical protein